MTKKEIIEGFASRLGALQVELISQAKNNKSFTLWASHEMMVISSLLRNSESRLIKLSTQVGDE